MKKELISLTMVTGKRVVVVVVVVFVVVRLLY